MTGSLALPIGAAVRLGQGFDWPGGAKIKENQAERLSIRAAIHRNVTVEQPFFRLVGLKLRLRGENDQSVAKSKLSPSPVDRDRARCV
jgi:hypothetical protein